MLDKQDQSMSQVLNNDSRGYLTDGQKSMNAPPAPTSMYVPGIGMLGPDLGGYVKGVQAAQEYRLNENDNKRKNAAIGIDLNKASMDTKTFEHSQAIQAGMSQAAQQGGFHAVVDYLQNADPVMALNFMQAKSTLDKSMMENETYQYAHSNDKSLAMLQGYQMLGGIGSTVLKAKPEDRQKVYQSLLPIAKQVDPGISDSLDDAAVAKLGLGMSLSTPAAILYDNKKQAVQYQSDIGKMMSDYTSAVSKYGENSDQAKILAKSVNDKSQYLDRLTLQTANTIATNNRSGESNLRNQWLAQTKDFGQMAQSNSAVQMATRSAKKPDGSIKGPDDMATIYNYYKMLDPTSIIMPAEYANAENTKGWSDSMRVQYNKIKAGDKLSDAQRSAFAKSAGDLYENKSKSFYSLKTQFRDVASRNGYNPDNITISGAEAYLPKPPDTAIQFLKQNPSPDVQKQFQYKYGQNALNEAIGAVDNSQPGAQNAQ